MLQLPFIIHTSLGHEIAHCWWGNGVLVDISSGNWSEGLTSYVADYFYKERAGEGRSYRQQWLRNYASIVDVQNDFALSRFTSRSDPVTKVVGYDKGAMVFHMLRHQLGDGIFWATLRSIYARFLFKAVSWKELELELTTQSTPQRKTITIAGARTVFSMASPLRPQVLRADADTQLFRRLVKEEAPPTINGIRGASKITVIVARALGRQGLELAQRMEIAL